MDPGPLEAGPDWWDEPVEVSGEVLSDLADLADTPDEPSCTPFWLQAKPTGPSTLTPPPDSGVNQWERAAFEKAAEIILEQPVIHIVSTYLHEEGCYLVRSKGGFVKFKREVGPDGFEFPVVESGGDPVFNDTNPTRFSTYQEELKAGSNPLGSSYPDFGYEADDPRLSFIEPEDHSFPYPFERIAQLFDSSWAPDLHYGLKPCVMGSMGNHGSLDVLQSRAALIFSGAGVRQGVVSEQVARLVDMAPTVLAVLGASPVDGLDPQGRPSDKLLLAWQDGRVLDDVMTGECGGAQHALVVLFDGLNPNELLFQHESGNPDVAHFSWLIDQGTVMRYGGVSPYPSASGPGHLTVATGTWNGHHGLCNNGMYRREDGFTFNYGYALANIMDFIQHPEQLVELLESLYDPTPETLFQAVHRSFGNWDPDTGQGAYTVSINEMAYRGADYSVLTLLGADLDGTEGDRYDYTMLDSIAVTQMQSLMEDPALPVPRMAMVSFYATDQIGEEGGPHGDLLREWLPTADEQLGALLDLYQTAGVLDDTLVVIVSDHGMETQDLDRYQNWKTPLKQAGIRFRDPDGSAFLYFKSLRVEASAQALVREQAGQVTLTVTDDDTGTPISGAMVKIEGADDFLSTTDEAGMAVVEFTPPTSAPVTLTITHEDFNPATIELTVAGTT